MPKVSATARTLACSSLIALAAAGAAHAAALEQVVPTTIRLLYQEGRYIEFGITYTDPDQSGERRDDPARSRSASGPGAAPGQHRRRLRGPLEHQRRLQGGPQRPALLRADLRRAAPRRHPLRRRQPSRAAAAAARSLYGGSKADLKTYQITGVLAYDVNPNVKVFGGVRAQLLEAKAAVSFVINYSVDAEDKWGYGYLVGAAYERPEIALRVALTYYSKISYDLDTTETFAALAGSQRHRDRRRHPAVGARSTSRPASTPKTLVFGYGPLGRLVRVLDQPARSTRSRSSSCSASRGRSSTTPTTGGPTTSASAGSSPTRSPAPLGHLGARASAAR